MLVIRLKMVAPAQPVRNYLCVIYHRGLYYLNGSYAKRYNLDQVSGYLTYQLENSRQWHCICLFAQ